MEHVFVASGGFFVTLLVCFAIAGFIGWFAELMVGSALGLFADTIFATLGALMAGRVLPQIGISLGSGFYGLILSAAVGAIFVLLALRLIRRAA